MNTLNTLSTSSLTKSKGVLVRNDLIYAFSKRSIDIIVSLSMLLLLLPLLLTVFAIVRITSKGNVLYWQKRVGTKGKLINFPKIRSMIQNADTMLSEIKSQSHHVDSITFKSKNDPRVTSIGRVIRKLSIDELPQLWLVLTGEMSLVGPRPALVDEVNEYNYYEKQRLLVKPGLTCIWQVSGRGDIPFKEQVEMDLDYIQNRSLKMDIKLLFLTIPAVLTGKGAY